VTSDGSNDTDRAGDRSGPKTDARQIDLGDAVERPFPAPPVSEYRVILSREAFEAIRAHAASDTTVELCGVLAGKLSKDVQGPYLVIERAIAGVATRRAVSQVTFTHETWDHIHKELEAKYPELAIVGWYHTHPGFGVFLSEMDQFIQDNFFAAPHQVAFVYDPVSDERGLFVWREGRSARLRRYWLADTVTYDLESEAPPPPREPNRAAGERPERHAADDDETGEHDLEGERRVGRARTDELSLGTLATIFAGVLLAVFAAFWLGGSMSRVGPEEDRRQVADIENLFRSRLFRDGLNGELVTVSGHLGDLHTELTEVRSALERLPDPKGEPAREAAEGLDRALTGIREVHGSIARMRRAYTAAGKASKRIEAIGKLPDSVGELAALMASDYLDRASRLLDEGDAAGAEARKARARELLRRAELLNPGLKEAIERERKRMAPPEDESPEAGD
jgi:proteasome lid subunit RPN8/RPN11